MAQTVKIFDPNNKAAGIQTGYVIDGKTYLDEAGTQRVSAGTYSQGTNGHVYHLGAGDVGEDMGVGALDAFLPKNPTGAPTNNTIGQIGGGSLIDQSTASQIEAAKKSFQTGIDSLNADALKLPEQYAALKNQAAGQSELSKANFNEYAAANGLNSGVGGQAELSRVGELNTTLATADRAMVGAQNDIGLKKTQVQNELAAALADIEANAAVQKQNQANSDRARQDELDAIAYQKDLQGKSEFANTVGAYGGDYQSQIDAVQNDGDPSNDWQINYLKQALQQQIIDKANAQAQAEQQNFENELALYKAQHASASGGGSGTKAPTFAQVDNQLQDMYDNGATEQEMYDYAIQWGGENTPQLLAKHRLTGGGNASPGTGTGEGNYTLVKQQVMNMLNSSAMGGGVDWDKITAYIDNSGLSEEEIYQLMTELNLA